MTIGIKSKYTISNERHILVCSTYTFNDNYYSKRYKENNRFIFLINR